MYSTSAGQRVAHLPAELAAGLEDGPADAFVPLAQDALKLTVNVFAARHAALLAVPDDVADSFDEKPLGQDDVRSHRGHLRKALIGGHHPGVGQTGSGLLVVVLKQRGTGGRLESEIVHALPISADDAGGGVEVRQHPRVGAGLVEKPVRAHFSQARDILQAPGSEGFIVARAPAEGHDDHLAGASRGLRQSRLRRDSPRQQQPGALQKLPFRNPGHQV